MATLYILYGSATGNAEQIAKDLAEKPLPVTQDDNNCHFSSVVCKPLQQFKKFLPEWEQEPCLGKKHGLIVISSTTGNGDAPENASAFVRFIKRKQTAETRPLKHCAVAVLGLGDTNYDNFCETAKVIDSKVVELGAERAMPLSCADDATGLEDVVEGWLDEVFVKMSVACRSRSEDDKGLVNGEDTKEEEADVFAVTVPSKPLPSQSDSPLYIMYGSATGNSEQIAKDLAASYECLLENPDALTFFPSVVCCELNQFKKHLPTWAEENASGSKHGLLVVASTTGNAESPENCTRFMSFIKRRQNVELQPFRHVGFAVLGLGDSNYDVFCATGKEVDRKLSALGGTSAKPLACADEGVGLEDVVDPWTVSVFADITSTCRGGPMQNPSVTQPPATAAAKPALAHASGSSPNDEEEKKSESITEMTLDLAFSLSPGVTMIKGMLGLGDDSNIPEVPLTLLPSLGASRSSCELFHGDDDPTLQAGEVHDGSDNVLYTQTRPYESNLVSARYLTKTSIDAAVRIAEATGSEVDTSLESFVKARECLEEMFPLDGVDSAAVERNGKRVIEVSMRLPDDNSLVYQPGDTIGLMVPNNSEAVSFILGALKEHHGLLPTQKISINEERPITVQKALEEWVDLCSILKSKKILNGLSQFASNQQEAAALRLLASKDSNGIRLFQEYIVDQRRSFVDILKDFPSCRSITIEGILSLFPAITPRYYSISSTPLESRKEPSLSIAFSVVDYLTPSLVVNGTEFGRRRVHGLATLFLESLCGPLLAEASGKPATIRPTVRIFPKPTAHFRLPASLSTPMILIGPGTGIAPFMGFLDHRKAQMGLRVTKEASSAVVEGTERTGYEMEANVIPIPMGGTDSDPAADYGRREKLGDITVFFGCRHEDHDWLFQDEMKMLVAKGTITSLHTAFSRGNHKQYVQDLMKEPSISNGLVDLLLTKSGVVYICGDGNAMARDVQKVLAEILGQQADGSISLEQGRGEIDRLKKEGRFLLDIWS